MASLRLGSLCIFIINLSLFVHGDTLLEKYLNSGTNFLRNKRANAPGVSGAEVNPGECISKCLEQMESSTQKNLPNFGNVDKKASDPTAFFVPSMAKDTLERFCTQIYAQTSKCVKTCPHDSLTDHLTMTLTSLNYVCLENFDNFKTNFDCLKSAYNQSVNTVCKSEWAFYTITKARNAAPPAKTGTAPPKDADQIMDDECKAMMGADSCMMKNAEKMCNHKSSEIIADLYSVMLESAEHSLNFFTPNDASVKLPDSCIKVKKLSDWHSSASSFSKNVLSILMCTAVVLLRCFY